MWAYAPCSAWSILPLEGENQEDEADGPGRACGAAGARVPSYERHRHGHSLVTTLYFVKSL
jgi:hypothetical protein